MIIILKNISILKTIWLNFKVLPIKKAILLPIFVARQVKCNKLKCKIIIESEISTGMILIGFGDVPIFDRNRSRSILNLVSGTIIFKGKASFGHGTKIGCGGKLIFGNNFSITAETTIICGYEIIFGDNVLISWNCQIMDVDFHKIFQDNKHINPNKKIIVGDHCWIGSKVIINKGTDLASDIVVASGSVVTGKFLDENILIGGIPAKKLKEDITWTI